jgi:hypothetical protein
LAVSRELLTFERVEIRAKRAGYGRVREGRGFCLSPAPCTASC